MIKAEGQILIIDDDPGICTTLCDILEDEGYEVKDIREGRKALDLLKKNPFPFDVVFVDIKLPDIDGMELLEQIKLINPESAVIMITGHASTATAVEALNEGAYAYVVKPFDLDELKTIVRKAIKEIRLSLENKKLIDQLQRTNRELERYKKSLEVAVKKAAAATEAKSKFLANMSHEIRTPMNAIIGFSDILADEELTEEQSHYVNTIRSSGEHLLQVIDDILDFSKIEVGKLDIEMSLCSLGNLLALVETMIHPLAVKKELKFEIRGDDALPANIRTDRARLQQCLINLVNNAIKFTEKGNVYINVSLEDINNQPYIRFDVEDTGIGIPAKRQKVIFESFTQADESTSRKYGGTGLGLAITRQLAELLGGKLTLTSEEGKGSVFSIVIPAGLDITKQPLLNRYNIGGRISIDKGKKEQPKFSGHVLVAEDIEANQMLVKLLLNRLDLEVTIASDGNEVLQKALTGKFDLILMDIRMPRMNGYDTTKALRKKGITIPIIALTAHATKGDDKKCIKAGCDDYLAKPLNRRELLKKLHKYLPSGKQTLIETTDSVKPQTDELPKLCCNRTYQESGSQDKPDVDEDKGIINWDYLIDMLGDEKSIREIMPTYLANKNKLFEKLTEAINAGDAKEIDRQAHAIKGTARNFGAKKMSDIAGRLESAGKENDVKTATLLFDELKLEFEKLLAFLSKPNWIEIAKQQANCWKEKQPCSSINP